MSQTELFTWIVNKSKKMCHKSCCFCAYFGVVAWKRVENLGFITSGTTLISLRKQLSRTEPNWQRSGGPAPLLVIIMKKKNFLHRKRTSSAAVAAACNLSRGPRPLHSPPPPHRLVFGGNRIRPAARQRFGIRRSAAAWKEERQDRKPYTLRAWLKVAEEEEEEYRDEDALEAAAILCRLHARIDGDRSRAPTHRRAKTVYRQPCVFLTNSEASFRFHPFLSQTRSLLDAVIGATTSLLLLRWTSAPAEASEMAIHRGVLLCLGSLLLAAGGVVAVCLGVPQHSISLVMLGLFVGLGGTGLLVTGLCVAKKNLQAAVPGHFLLHPRTGTRFSPRQAQAIQRYTRRSVHGGYFRPVWLLNVLKLSKTKPMSLFSIHLSVSDSLFWHLLCFGGNSLVVLWWETV